MGVSMAVNGEPDFGVSVAVNREAGLGVSMVVNGESGLGVSIAINEEQDIKKPFFFSILFFSFYLLTWIVPIKNGGFIIYIWIITQISVFAHTAEDQTGAIHLPV